jgi:hypothetical protein
MVEERAQVGGCPHHHRSRPQWPLAPIKERAVAAAFGDLGKPVTVASKWIAVPTGRSYALENLYWYDQNVNVNNDFLTALATPNMACSTSTQHQASPRICEPGSTQV